MALPGAPKPKRALLQLISQHIPLFAQIGTRLAIPSWLPGGPQVLRPPRKRDYRLWPAVGFYGAYRI